jgi:hypothetical protein
MNDLRTLRLQLMLSHAELSAIDDFRFKYRLPFRAAAVRELMKRGLAATIPPAARRVKSNRNGVLHAELGW